MTVVSIANDTARQGDDEVIIALHGEKFDFSTRPVVTGQVDVSTVTHLRDVVIDEALISQHADVERVAIGRVVETAPEMREEDGVLIIPIIQEIVVLERRFFLKEEVRIHRSTRTHRHHETVTLREQEAIVTRTQVAQNPDAGQLDSVSVTPEEILP